MVDEKYRRLKFQRAVTLLGGAGFSEYELRKSLRQFFIPQAMKYLIVAKYQIGKLETQTVII